MLFNCLFREYRGWEETGMHPCHEHLSSGTGMVGGGIVFALPMPPEAFAKNLLLCFLNLFGKSTCRSSMGAIVTELIKRYQSVFQILTLHSDMDSHNSTVSSTLQLTKHFKILFSLISQESRSQLLVHQAVTYIHEYVIEHTYIHTCCTQFFFNVLFLLW